MKTRPVLFLLCIFSLGTALRAESPKPYTLHYEVALESKNFGNAGTRKMWIRGGDMRWDYQAGGLTLSVVRNKQGVFLLDPWSKVAAKYSAGSNRGNPRALFPGPTGSPKGFLKGVGAVKRQRETVAKQLCDAYSYIDPVTKRRCDIWIGVRSGKPVRLLVKGTRKSMDTLTARYTKFVEGASVPDSLFQVPREYAVRPMPAREHTTKKTTEKRSKQRKSG